MKNKDRNDPVIQLKKVSAGYSCAGKQKEILHDVSLNIEDGEFVVIIGPSGCGKTTLLKLINGLIVPEKGDVLVEGQNLKDCDLIQLRRHIGYVVQGAKLFPHMTVGDNICFVPGISGKMAAEEKQVLIKEMLHLVQLPEEMKRCFPSQISGGQQQRVGIGRALASHPRILLMDEPFGAVDGITRKGLQRQLLELKKKTHLTVVFITHDINEAVKLGSRILVMQEGNIVQDGAPEELREHPANSFVKELFS